MATLLNVLHVVGAVFLVGPMAILPMTGLRALRAGDADQVSTLARSTFVFSLLSLLVAVFGFGVMSLADDRFDLSVTTPWILWSIVLYAVALVLNLLVVVPAMRSAAEALERGDLGRGGYGRIAGASGVSSLLLVAVVVLMVWKPQ
ncbi:DUF2269 family protein [Naasia sp. SYSU D00057]|uniref:DUF2269 family protein n=1 Tax=Naasia sp. SYSU D00057 TaxID=2817380 RepID=UPI001B30AC26|nr:DUF2269 family protein [Naasia sp. SYSU D00057]